jgi:1,4-dihydroxy-6-naphthoate synthase
VAQASSTRTIRLAFSPDSDDLFMFWPLLTGKLPEAKESGLTFTAERADTETLNERAERADADVIAVSMAHYARISAHYMLLPHGASVGRGYGPIVVSEKGGPIESLRGKRIAIPGERTTAFAVLRLLFADFTPVVVPIAPYSRVFEALRNHEVDAALLIHEGRLTYEREGFRKVLDIGEGWDALTHLPLPLGGNAIARALGPETIAKVSDLCRASIAWSLAHREEVMRGILAEDGREDVKLDHAMLDRYLTMYANEDTREMREDVRSGVRELVSRMKNAGLIDDATRVDFAP